MIFYIHGGMEQIFERRLSSVRLYSQVNMIAINAIKIHSMIVSSRLFASIPPNLAGACQTSQIGETSLGWRTIPASCRRSTGSYSAARGLFQ